MIHFPLFMLILTKGRSSAMIQLKNHICFNSVMTLLFPLARYLILQSSVYQEWSCVVVLAKKMEKTLLEA